MLLEIKKLSKKYGKENFGLKDFSLSMENGILGLLAPNGAGKSTLLKMIATISKPTEGGIYLNKVNIVKEANFMRKQLGYLPQDFGVYPNLNAIEFMNYIAAIKGVGGNNLKSKINYLLEGLNILEVAKRPIGSYSGGMKQRLGIAQALLNDPKVILFDEPTVGLDPEERVRFRNLIADLANECLVILSSHIVSDIDTIADEVAILKSGELIEKGKQGDLIQLLDGKVFELKLEQCQLAHFKTTHLVVNTTRSKDEILVRFISDQTVEHATEQQANLEDAYLYLINSN